MPVLDLGSVVGPKGEQGATGPQGVQGDPGPAATINGVNALTIKAGDSITLKQEGSALEIGAVVPGKNLLINSDFRRPVNRNGKREYTGSGYSIDCWFIGGNRKIIVEAGYVRIQRTGTANNAAFEQRISSDAYAGLTVTLSILYRTSESNIRLGLRYNDTTEDVVLIPASPSWTIFSNTFNIPTGTNMIYARPAQILASASADAYIDLIAAKLELGDHQTLARQNADGEWEIIDPPDYDLQYLLCSQYSPITGEWVGSQHSNENLLDNSRLDINQRGLSEYTNYGYTVDRWALGGNAKNGKYTAASKTLSCDSTTTAFIYLEQKIESPSRFAGKTLTLSALFGSANRAIVQIWRSNSLGTVALAASGTWGNDLFQFCSAKIPNDVSDSDYIRIIVQTQNSIQIKATKLELGPVPTLAHKEGDTWVLNDPPPNIALELLKCQRYYVAFEDNVFATGSEVAIYANAQFALSGTKFPVKMRAVPTITIKDVRVWSGEQYEVGNVSAFGVNAGGFTGIDSSTMKFSANHIAYYFHYTADANL